MMRVVGILLHRGRQLFHAGCGLLNRRGLLLGTGRQIGVPCRNLTGTAINFFRALTNRAHCLRQRPLHSLQMAAQAANFAAPGRFLLHRQIPY